MKITGTCSRHRSQRLLVKELIVDGKEVKGGGSASIPVATPTADGLLAATDKAKLDGIAEGATKFTDANAIAALKAKPAIVALVSPVADFSDLKTATAAFKAVVDALKA